STAHVSAEGLHDLSSHRDPTLEQIPTVCKESSAPQESWRSHREPRELHLWYGRADYIVHTVT
ncbi:hypothetical protein NDU88_000612, partial [Pleurodeles waltl]